MPPFKIAPSILSADFANLQSEIEKVTAAGADWLHVDVMDGHFVPNLTIGVPVVASLKKVAKIPLDVHLMIETPEKYVDQFLAAGADWLTIHVEATKDPVSVLRSIRKQGRKAGITLRPGTAVEKVLPLLPEADLALVMTVEPGFGGQKFMADQVAKIQKLREVINHQRLSTLIEVDGGINDKTKDECREADVLVAGNYIFKHPQGYAAGVSSLRARE